MKQLLLFVALLSVSACGTSTMVPMGSGREVWMKEGHNKAGGEQSSIPDAIYFCVGGEHPTCTQATSKSLPSK